MRCPFWHGVELQGLSELHGHVKNDQELESSVANSLQHCESKTSYKNCAIQNHG